MILVKPSKEFLKSYAEAIEENRIYRPDGEQIFSNPDTIISASNNGEQGIDLLPGYVKSTTLWLVEGDKFLGQVNIRHELTPSLLNYGGHIGYEIRWSECGKGYGTRMLSMTLAYCKEHFGFRRVLLTCDDTNAASAKVIEKNGGVIESKVINNIDRGTVITRRYWIEI